MAYNRAQLNGLIFHNEVVLPRTSPGFGKVSLAVAELQGGNYQKAAMYAEFAVGKDPQLAAGWLAKTAADVFEATPDDLRKDRAVFCMDRALDCAPSCRAEIVGFFVSNILSHYVKVLCQSALEQLGVWKECEAQANAVLDQGREIGSQARGLSMRSLDAHRDASRLEATSLVTGLTALFSHRLGTQILSGMATGIALSEAEGRRRDADLLSAHASAMHSVSIDMSKAGRELWMAAAEHRTASLLPLIPARDLIELAARLLCAERSTGDALDPLIEHFAGTFQQVLHAHLTWLQQRQLPVFGAHPMSQPMASGLTRILPGSKRNELERLVSRYLPGRRRRGKGKMLAVLGLLLGFFFETAFVMAFCSFLASLFAQHGAGAGHTSADALVGLCFSLVAILGLDRLRAACFCRVKAGPPHVGNGMADERDLLRRGLLGEQMASLVQGRPATSGPPSLPSPASPGHSPAERALRLGRTVLKGYWGSVAIVTLGVFLFCVEPPRSAVPAPEPTAAPAPAASSESPRPTGKPAAMVRRALPVSATTPLPDRATPTAAPVTGSYAITGIAAGDTLNVRTGPGTSNEVCAKLPNGYNGIQIVGAPVLNGTTSWVQIRFDERTGWVTRSYLRSE